jgi:hypothetical protein
MDWIKKELWHKRHSLFTVEVSHWLVEKLEPFDDVGSHRWAVYCYIYPNHPMFNEFDGDSSSQDADKKLPLHGGSSFFVRHCKTDGTVTSIQVGGDYNHLGDDHYTFIETKEHAFSVFHDADELFAFLKEYKPSKLDA